MRALITLSFCFVALLCGFTKPALAAEVAAAPAAREQDWPMALDFTMDTLDGKEVHLAEKYAGKVVLLVNVASRCGFTKQYDGLQALHEKYGKEGLAVVALPCNQFGGQEPGTAAEIAEFCEQTFGVEFDMLGKANVRRDQDDQCPLYAYLTDEEKLPELGSDIKWNFEKFLINRQGEVIGHYRSKVAPESKPLTKAIEAALAEPSEEGAAQ